MLFAQGALRQKCPPATVLCADDQPGLREQVKTSRIRAEGTWGGRPRRDPREGATVCAEISASFQRAEGVKAFNGPELQWASQGPTALDLNAVSASRCLASRLDRLCQL